GLNSPFAFKRQKDPFANPVGHSLRVGTRRIFEALLRGMDLGKGDLGKMDVEKIRQDLHEMVKIRAVQQFSASEAVGFIFHLKEAVRAQLAEAVKDPRFSDELAQLDGQIDRVALAAFDLFVQCREQVYELRVNEVKRRVSWVMDKMGQNGFDSPPAPDPSPNGDAPICGCPEPAGGLR
ncbi:unnamed protein product, partial [marine sediment metagenome]